MISFLFLIFFFLFNTGFNLSDLKSAEELRDKMRRARKDGDITALEKAVRECEEAGYPELSYDLSKARDTLETLNGGRGG